MGRSILNSANEEWKAVPGWDGYYEVSSAGRIRSVDRAVMNRLGVVHSLRGKVLSPATGTSTGHLRVNLTRDGWRYSAWVHRMVLEAFIGPCPEGMECCHNNGDATDNRIDNLRWDTRKANIADSIARGTHYFRNAKLERAKRTGARSVKD